MDNRELRAGLIRRLDEAGIDASQLGTAADAVAEFLAEEYTLLPSADVVARRLGAGSAIVLAAWNFASGERADPIAAIVCDTHGPGMDALAEELAEAIAAGFGVRTVAVEI